MVKQSLKKLLHPLRVVAGRFAISPAEQRAAHLEALLAEWQRNSWSNAIVYKAAAFIAADKIAGDYLEFGVFAGGSFANAYRCLQEAFKQAYTPGIWNTSEDCVTRQELWANMRFFAFDSFQGLPSPTGIDTQSQDFVEGKFACSEEDFKRNVAQQGVPLERITTVPGWFNHTANADTFKKHRIQQAAIVNIDCDLYESTKDVLAGITPLLVDGTVIIFDDWYNYRGNPNLGEQRACKEWLAAHPELTLTEYQKEGPWRNSFVVSRHEATLG
jgi:O-methyltransferase